MKSSRAFTLIELLVVIAIIGILMALLFPAVGSAIDAAKKAQAKNDVVQIATAVTAYETEYGRLPMTNGTAIDVSGDFLSALKGLNPAAVPNPRQIVFIEVPTAKKGKSGESNSAFVDPWGTAYKIIFDTDYDNRIPATKAGEANYIQNSTELMKKVAVWNNPEPSTGNAGQKKRRAVVSWE